MRIGLLIATGLLLATCFGCAPDVSSAVAVDAAPRIDPDYTSLVIPPNIAPLNFRIREEGRDYLVRVSSDGAPTLDVRCRDGKCRFNLKAWREMLRRNKGKQIYLDVYARKGDGAWTRFRRITNAVAEEPIDSYIVYRQLEPDDMYSAITGIFQRDLESFKASAILTLRDGTFHCFNCHTFCQNDPNRFLVHVRMKYPGMVLVVDGKVRRINTQVGPMWRPMAFASWHPDGNHIAATLNRFNGYFLTHGGPYYFEAVEKRGNLVVYNVEKNSISTSKAVFGEEYIETHPCWSPDGKYIYFVRCKDRPLRAYKDLEGFRADLARISYDTATDTWGSPEIVMAYSQLGKSCAFPRVSPDGRYVLHILSDKTTYPIHQRSSDLYVFDLQTKAYRRLDAANSDLAESFPCWSLNGRWFSFLSTRRNGMSALPYFAYFDKSGQARKAFLLPQEDPAWYDAFIESFNVLQLVKSRVTIDPAVLAREIQKDAVPAAFPNPPQVDACTGATRKSPGLDSSSRTDASSR